MKDAIKTILRWLVTVPVALATLGLLLCATALINWTDAE